MSVSDPLSGPKGAIDARVVYLLDGAPLFGGVKVVLDQANLLTDLGYDVLVRCTTARPEWMELSCAWEETEDLSMEIGSATRSVATIVIGTYWTTLRPAAQLGGRFALHYCQGYEALYSHNTEDHPAVREAYSLPLPALTVSPHLSSMLEAEYGRRSQVVRQPLPSGYRPAAQPRSNPERVRILVMSPVEIDWKGVVTALEALSIARSRGVEFELVRVAQFEQGAAEKAFDLGGEYHCGIKPTRVQELMRHCDLLLAPSWEAEGFGLPVLEAMASGVPTVASDVECFRSWTRGASHLVAPREPQLWADAIQRVLSDRRHADDLKVRGLRLAEDYSAVKSVASFERAVRELLPLESIGRG